MKLATETNKQVSSRTQTGYKYVTVGLTAHSTVILLITRKYKYFCINVQGVTQQMRR